MRITQNNFTYNSLKHNHQVNTQNFKGLWGKTSRNSDFDSVLGIPKIEETSYYYPFADETKDDVRKIVSANTSAIIDESDDSPKYKIKDCKICTTLPFKKVHYDNYAAMTASSKLYNNMRTVHYSVKDKYTNNGYGSEQISAMNEEVAKKLDLKS